MLLLRVVEVKDIIQYLVPDLTEVGIVNYIASAFLACGTNFIFEVGFCAEFPEYYFRFFIIHTVFPPQNLMTVNICLI